MIDLTVPLKTNELECQECLLIFADVRSFDAHLRTVKRGRWKTETVCLSGVDFGRAAWRLDRNFAFVYTPETEPITEDNANG